MRFAAGTCTEQPLETADKCLIDILIIVSIAEVADETCWGKKRR
jgi:hypothetical protein